MNVGVDEAGAHDLAGRVDDLLRGRVAEPPDRGDAVAGDADIGLEPRQPGPVHDATVADEDVEHGGAVVRWWGGEVCCDALPL